MKRRALEALPLLVLEDHTTKIYQPMYIKDWSLPENFQTDMRPRLLKGEFWSRRRSPSRIAPRKFPNRCASRIAYKKNFEVGKEVHRRSLHEIFSTDVRPNRYKCVYTYFLSYVFNAYYLRPRVKRIRVVLRQCVAPSPHDKKDSSTF